MEEQTKSDDRLRVQVGDLITKGHGDEASIVLISWTRRPYHFDPPVDAVTVISPVGYDHEDGFAAPASFMDYLGSIDYTDDEIDAAVESGDDFAARSGHTWAVNEPGWSHMGTSWRETVLAR